MSTLEFAVLVITLINAGVGAWSICWARREADARRCLCGRIVFVVNLIALGGAGLFAASTRAHGLPGLGLIAGLLVVGMMWENPATTRRAAVAAPLPPDGQAA